MNPGICYWGEAIASRKGETRVSGHKSGGVVLGQWCGDITVNLHLSPGNARVLAASLIAGADAVDAAMFAAEQPA